MLNHALAEAICTEAAVMFSEGCPLIFNDENLDYGYYRTGPQTFELRVEGQTFKIHVRSMR